MRDFPPAGPSAPPPSYQTSPNGCASALSGLGECRATIVTLEVLLKQLSRLIAFAFALTVLAAIPAKPLSAQNNITQQKVGDIVYYGGTSNGQAVSGTAQRMGNVIYYNLIIGGVSKRWTEQVVGQQTYGHGSDGSSATSQKVGNQTYTQSSSGVTYTRQRIGDFIYITGSNGCRSTIQIIGTQQYTSGNC